MSTQVIQNTAPKVSTCEGLIQYTFNNKLLCLQALNSANLPIEHAGMMCQPPRNDALAVLGDVQMGAVLCNWWWQQGVRVKGQWDAMRQDQLNNPTLAAKGRQLGIDRCVLLNPGTFSVSNKMGATAVEAIAGAVYLDGGEAELEKFMGRLGIDAMVEREQDGGE